MVDRIYQRNENDFSGLQMPYLHNLQATAVLQFFVLQFSFFQRKFVNKFFMIFTRYNIYDNIYESFQ